MDKNHIKLKNIRNILENPLVARKTQSKESIIYDYIEQNINELFFNSKNINFKYDIDKENGILNIHLYMVGRSVELNNEYLVKFSSLNKIIFNLYDNYTLFFINRGINHTNILSDLNIDLNYKFSISDTQISIFYDGLDKIKNCNINITPDKINQNNNEFLYNFDNFKFNLFNDIKSFENFLDSILFKNNIISSKNNNLILELDNSNKKYKDLKNNMESIGYDNYMDYLNKNILKNKYKLESIKFSENHIILKIKK